MAFVKRWAAKAFCATLLSGAAVSATAIAPEKVHVDAPASGLFVGICDTASLTERLRVRSHSLVDETKSDGMHPSYLAGCEHVLGISAGHDAYLIKSEEFATFPEFVRQDRTLGLLGKGSAVTRSAIVVNPYQISGSQFTVVDVPAAVLPDFAAIPGDRERLRPLAPRMKRAPTPMILGVRNQASKAEVVNRLDAEEFTTVMRRLTGVEPAPVGSGEVSIKTRYTLSPQNAEAAQYILEYFEALGLEAFYHTFRYSSTTTQNIIGVKRGTTRPDEVVVYGAHMDSISQQSSTDAPGCIDNGSGTGAVLLTARAFANVTTDRTIYFMLFSAEEQGLVGSEVFVEDYYETGQYDRDHPGQLPHEGAMCAAGPWAARLVVLVPRRLNVVSALTMDMIGYSNRYLGVLIEGTNDPDIVELMNGMNANTKEFAPQLTTQLSYFSYGSDHVSFQRAGIPAFLSIEQDNTNYPGYHATTDTISYLNVEQSIGITRGMTGLLYDVAGGVVTAYCARF